MYYYFIQLVVVGWAAYAEVVGKLSQFQLIMIILVSLIVELLVALNRKFDSVEVNIEDEEEKK